MRSPVERLLRFVLWSILLLMLTMVLAAGALWAAGPYLLAPAQDFPQGPGGSVAYVSLLNQMRSQSAAFASGQEVRIEMNEEEFSGMLSSALLSGRTAEAPIRKVRGSLPGGAIRVEAILQFQRDQVPERFQGPIGLNLRLVPMVAEDGLLRFRIAGAGIGKIPIPIRLVQWAGTRFPLNAPSLDLSEPAITLPISDMIASSLGRRVTVTRFSADDGKLVIMIAAPKQP